jgi:hypothetical protein
MQSPLSRRILVKTLALGVSGAFLGEAKSGSKSASASGKLDVKDPAAVALGYVENAAQVDAKKYPSFIQGSNCENCLQLKGKAGDNYRPCSTFNGKLVSVNGWCSAWAAEM